MESRGKKHHLLLSLSLPGDTQLHVWQMGIAAYLLMGAALRL